MDRPAPFAPAHLRRLLLWLALLCISLALLLTQGHWEGVWLAEWTGAPYPVALVPGTVLMVFTAALLCEFMDTGLGMGFGTLMAPLLLIIGFEPLDIVPAVLFSELLTGLAAGLLHRFDGNIDLIRDRRARRTLILLAALSTVGAVAAVLFGIQFGSRWFAFGGVAVVLVLGLLTLAKAGQPACFRGWGILAIALMAAFSKGVSGGGYGPLVTSGQIVCGLPARQAVAITSIAEALTCLVVLMGYVAVKGAPDWTLALPLAGGALLAVPWATLGVHHLPQTWLRAGVGVLTLALGLWSLFTLVG